MRKKLFHFLLIEIMIALALIGICGFYFIKPSYEIAAARQRHLELIQLGRISKEQSVKVKMELLAQTLELPSSGELSPVTCTLPSGKETLYQCYYQLKRSKKSNKENKKKGEIYHLHLTFTHKDKVRGEFTYPLYIEEVNP